MLRHAVMVLAYFGQATYLMKNKEHVSDAFYRSIPGSILRSSSILLFVSTIM